MAFRILRDISRDTVGEANVLDLSQGEPGYGFSPSKKGRQLFAFLMILDTTFNDHFTDQKLFAYRTENEIEEIDQIIKSTAKENFSTNKADEILEQFELFITELQKACKNQDLPHNRFEVLYQIFKYSNLAGGRYPEPFGQPLLQAVMAEEHSQTLNKKVKYHELTPVLGASHGIGTVFKGLGTEGIKFLHAGDYVVMTSPVYAPYNLMFQQRGINVLSLEVNPETGQFDKEQLEKLKNYKERIKSIVLIDPNNPTGFGGDENFLQAISELAETHNSLIVTDEVYLGFFREKQSLLHLPEAARRTIRIDSLSKIERSTGLRVGDIYISDEANKFITKEILGGYIGDYKDIQDLMHLAKSPSGKNIGLFQHITGIPGPSAGLALCHLLLGRQEREATTDMVIKKMEVFYKTLGLDYKNNLYYGMFNLRDIENSDWKDKSVQEKLKAVAEKGVVLMPAHLFFAESDRENHDRTHFVRVSLPNLSLENTQKAAEIIRDTLK